MWEEQTDILNLLQLDEHTEALNVNNVIITF